MKFTAIAGLMAVVAADVCKPNDLSWVLYKDENCKHVDRKNQKKYGHFQKGTKRLLSGDCEAYKMPEDSKIGAGMKIGVKITCDADGYHSSSWKSTKCRGDAAFDMTQHWGQCEAYPGQPGTYIIVKSKKY